MIPRGRTEPNPTMSEDQDLAFSTGSQNDNFTRYKSVRHAPANTQPTEASMPLRPPKDGNGLGRTKSMARYRRTKVESPEDSAEAPPPMPTLPSGVDQSTLAALSGKPSAIRRVTEPILSTSRHAAPPEIEPTAVKKSRAPGHKETEDERLRRKVLEFREREAQKEKLEEQKAQAEEQKLRARQRAEEDARASKQRKAQAQSEEREARLKEEETARLLEEQKRVDLERLEATLDAAGPRSPEILSPRDKFSFFSRKRATSKTSKVPPRTSGSGTSESSVREKSLEPPSPKRVEKIRKRTSSPPSRRVAKDPFIPTHKLAPEQMIQEGGGGIVPQTDAPISASNAGERRVLVRCKQSSINLPITPDTTSADLILSAANIMSQDIIPATAVLLESYGQLGLERRTRRYEHIRDIMNSWDQDTQNFFTLMNSEAPEYDKDLESSSAPKEAPGNTTVYMYHSQKPGKWNKRYITLFSTGQIYMSKKPPGKTNDKDTVSLCHLSDFDIYSSTPQETRKRLKPPKKYCYAIKSQQKTTMFLSTENFVHYFSTDDRVLSDQWYDAVQAWRSWYLVSRMGDGAKTKTNAARGRKNTHQSSDGDPYTIGTLAPVVNVDDFSKRENERKGREYESDSDRPRQIPFHHSNSVSQSPLPSKKESRQESRRHPPTANLKIPSESEDEFSSGGLLGRSYSQRQQRVQKEAHHHSYNGGNGFIDGPSLLSAPTQRPERSVSMRSTTTRPNRRPQTAADPPGPGMAGMPKPLLDFSPVFKEAPQWDKRGKGRGVQPVAGKRLVDVATTPEEMAAQMQMQPTQTLFRREQATELARSRTNARPRTSQQKESPFVGSGLVQNAGVKRRGS
ncbi:hypothetical protein HYFRA_00007599 [Hymenoscyphus fraxineus]|uniref:PH domain-containing protein n=1 Tax=Hymenoscyphus fraxineus TaxID=746836 RepID=A0A9N9KRN5_9HELO|nr:hypothetical protein HYFRA_00007599 [Hymenoscyphus fraxineus]